jgi:hypothetical protein
VVVVVVAITETATTQMLVEVEVVSLLVNIPYLQEQP